MRWRGQGILVVTVLIAAAVFGYQWKSVTHLEEEVTWHDIEYRPYTHAVARFVDEQKRWPEPGEVTLPEPESDSIIKKVNLENKSELLFTLSGWTLQNGRVTMRLAPTLNTHHSLLPYTPSRLEYTCREVIPASLERTLCMRIGVRSAAEISSENTDAFARWEKNESDAQLSAKRASALAIAGLRDTRCDRYLSHAERQILPCVQQFDAAKAQALRERLTEVLSGPRLRPEVIADNPGMLDQFNRSCDDNWQAITVMAQGENEKIAPCFRSQP